MIKEISVGTSELTTWQELADLSGISVAYCKGKFRGQYLPVVRRSGWGSPAIIMHRKYITEVALAFRSGMYEYVQLDAYWWGVRFRRSSETSAEVCDVWRIGEIVPFKVYAQVTWEG